jgi:hypothetical protein
MHHLDAGLKRLTSRGRVVTVAPAHFAKRSRLAGQRVISDGSIITVARAAPPKAA